MIGIVSKTLAIVFLLLSFMFFMVCLATLFVVSREVVPCTFPLGAVRWGGNATLPLHSDNHWFSFQKTQKAVHNRVFVRVSLYLSSGQKNIAHWPHIVNTIKLMLFKVISSGCVCSMYTMNIVHLLWCNSCLACIRRNDYLLSGRFLARQFLCILLFI